MKRILRLCLVATALVPIVFGKAIAEKKEDVAISRTAQAVDFTQAIDVSGFDRFSAQAAYSDGTPSTATLITSGAKSIASITVTSTSTLISPIHVQVPNNIITLTPGVNWSVGATTTLTAKAISDALMANSTLAALFISTWSGAVVTSTAIQNGNYNYNVDGPTGLTIVQYAGGAASDISLANDTVTKASHGFTTGLPLQFSTSSPNVAIGGLRNSVTYYAIYSDLDHFKLSDTSTGAVAGVVLNLTTLPDVTASTYTFLPGGLTVLAGNGFFWSAGNDGTNFTNLSVSSVTYSATGNSLWDFGEYSYKYLRINFKAPAFGGMALNVKLYGKKD